jgi:hypothetical protein
MGTSLNIINRQVIAAPAWGKGGNHCRHAKGETKHVFNQSTSTGA